MLREPNALHGVRFQQTRGLMQKNLKGYMKQDRKISSLEQEIEANLKRVYDDVAKQEVPDRFTQLLEQLRKADKSSSETSND